jgi:hypothetical protein
MQVMNLLKGVYVQAFADFPVDENLICGMA